MLLSRLLPGLSRRQAARALTTNTTTPTTTTTTTTPSIPDSAEVIVVGGGIIGTSIAYHLAKHGCKDVLLIEKDQLTSGTTWHAAGLMVTFGSLSETSTELRKYSKELYRHVLEEETGQSTGFKPCGFIEVATHKDRVEEYRRVAAFNRKCGIDVQEISPSEVRDLFPLCNVDDVLAGFYVPDDGRVNPYDATQALAKGARQRNVKILERTTVTGVTKTNDRRRVTGVVVQGEDGQPKTIESRVVVNAAGMWARQFGELAGVCVPNQVRRALLFCSCSCSFCSCSFCSCSCFFCFFSDMHESHSILPPPPPPPLSLPSLPTLSHH